MFAIVMTMNLSVRSLAFSFGPLNCTLVLKLGVELEDAVETGFRSMTGLDSDRAIALTCDDGAGVRVALGTAVGGAAL